MYILKEFLFTNNQNRKRPLKEPEKIMKGTFPDNYPIKTR